jgi:preprotein translocase subunit SecG
MGRHAVVSAPVDARQADPSSGTRRRLRPGRGVLPVGERGCARRGRGTVLGRLLSEKRTREEIMLWVTLVVAGAFFAAFIAMGYFGIQEREAQLERDADAVLARAPLADPDRCPLCSAPLRRPASSEEIVFAVEHRIDAELRDIAFALHSAPESFGRIYQA